MKPDPVVKEDATREVPADPPPELMPKRRGRPPGSGSKPKVATDAPEVSPRALAAAYTGLWLVLRFVTWIAAGRRNSPVAQMQGDGTTYRLDKLTSDEALSDARDLMPFIVTIAPLVRVLSWIGAPVIVVQRIQEKIRKVPPPAPPAQEETTGAKGDK